MSYENSAPKKEKGRHEEKEEREFSPEGIGGFTYSQLVPIVLAFALMAVLAYNQVAISSASSQASSTFAAMSAINLAAAPATATLNSQPLSQGGDLNSDGSPNLQAIESQIFSTGVPPVYGKELGVSFDNPVAAMPIMAAYDDGKPMADAAQNQRFVAIASQISCEYCCGANALIFNTGDAACGCQHSYAMRGLAKYLIKNHPEMSNAQILEELGKWKILFFPKEEMVKASAFATAHKALNITGLTSNQYRGFESGQAPASSGSLNDYASQVGGC